MDWQARFWARVDKSGDCWLWTGSLNAYGYGNYSRKGYGATSHRIAYTLVNGNVPRQLELHHICEVRNCVNPAHLMPVTRAEHRKYDLATHCPQGHELTTENTRYWKGIARVCRICKKEQFKRYYERKGRAVRMARKEAKRGEL